ncbi:MAG: hypothetical protein M3Y13_07110 [Armatimonadota bacterium]|nr:hypothetical protein [Armatimonadota bacterium]
MTITLDLKPEEERGLREEAARQGTTLDEFAQQALMDKMISDLKNQRIPQSLNELRPRTPLPPGKTIKDMLPIEPWPGDETDEELQAALKAMG